jgi:uncharacterized membrane protein YcaP (DUF421 family)
LSLEGGDRASAIWHTVRNCALEHPEGNAMATIDILDVLSSAGSTLFGGDTPTDPLALYQIAARAALVYAIGLVIIRVGKNRLVGRMTPVDVLIGITLGSLLSRGITGQASLSGTTAAAVAIVACHWLVTKATYRWHALGTLLKGRAVPLVENGVPDRERMRLSHISDHDLDEQLRLNGLESVADVRRAYEERNGEISVVKRAHEPRIVEVQVQAGVQTVRIAFGNSA